MEFIQTKIPDVILIQPSVIEDHRGFFMESYHLEKFTIGGIKCTFVQDNHTKSVQNTLRGLHFQVNYPQAKLLRCLTGKVFDVIDAWVRPITYENPSPNVPAGNSPSFRVCSKGADEADPEDDTASDIRDF